MAIFVKNEFFAKDKFDLVRAKFIAYFFIPLAMIAASIVQAGAQERLNYDTPSTVGGAEFDTSNR